MLGLTLTVVFLWPIFPNFHTHLTSRQDGILIAWLIDWGSEALLTDQNVFNAPFFHPYQNTLAYSDLFFSTALLNLPLKLLGQQNIIINHNWHLITGSLMVFWGQFRLGKLLFKRFDLAILSGVIFAFSHFHLDYAAHLHSFLVAGLPWSIYFWLKFKETKQDRYLLGLTLAGLYQFLNSVMSGYLLLTVLLPFLLNSQSRLVIQTQWRQFIPWGLGGGLIMWFFYWPYWQVFQEFHFVRTIRDAAHFSFGLDKLFEPQVLLFAGLFFCLLGLNHLQPLSRKTKLYLIITLLGGILMLGPVLKWQGQTIKIFSQPLPLPYAVMYYLVPGLKAVRATSRWIIVMGFGFALLLPQLLSEGDWWQHKNSRQKRRLGGYLTLAITIILLLSQYQTGRIYAVPTTLPTIYQTIATQPPTVLAEFPTYVWSQPDQYFHEADRLLFQSLHRQKLYNGFSGFAPPLLEKRWQLISDQLELPETIEHLKHSGVELIMLHGDENRTYQNFSHPNYELLTCSNHDCLYRLR